MISRDSRRRPLVRLANCVMRVAAVVIVALENLIRLVL